MIPLGYKGVKIKSARNVTVAFKFMFNGSQLAKMKK